MGLKAWGRRGLNCVAVVLLGACAQLGRVPPAEPDAAGELARGVVFEDRNASGLREAGEPGVPGVRVSNGLDVVLTDARGRYAIPLRERSILFISQPAGYAVPVDANQTAQFFYRHYPQGSAEVAAWTYPVIEPTGPLPARIDFALRPDPASAAAHFGALVFADPQAGTHAQEDMFRVDIVDELVGNPLGAQFGLTLGDIVHDRLSLYARHQPIMGSIGIPQWYLPGNHDLNFEAPDDAHSLETYKRHFGPAYYSFDYGNVHFLALDNVDYDGARYVGRLSPDQLRWIRNDLASVPNTKLLVIATHIPLRTGAGASPVINTVNLDALIEIIQDYGFERVYGMAGHHTSNSWKLDIDHEHGFHGYSFVAHTLAQARGSGWARGQRDERGVRDATMSDGNPNGYYLMRFADTRVQPRFIPASGNPAQPARFSFEPPLTGQAGQVVGGLNRGRLQPGTKLVINVFDGGARNRVDTSLDGGDWMPLEYVLRADPYVARQHEASVDADFRPAAPWISSHIWEMPLPDDLAPGLHHVRLRSRDEFDQRIRSGFSFEILPWQPFVRNATDAALAEE